jgi:PKD repeat protein
MTYFCFTGDYPSYRYYSPKTYFIKSEDSGEHFTTPREITSEYPNYSQRWDNIHVSLNGTIYLSGWLIWYKTDATLPIERVAFAASYDHGNTFEILYISDDLYQYSEKGGPDDISWELVRMRLDQNENIYLCFHFGSELCLIKSTDNGYSFSTPWTIPNSTRVMDFFFEIDKTGWFYVYEKLTTNYNILMVSKDDGASFHTVANYSVITNEFDDSMVIDNTGNVYYLNYLTNSENNVTTSIYSFRYFEQNLHKTVICRDADGPVNHTSFTSLVLDENDTLYSIGSWRLRSEKTSSSKEHGFQIIYSTDQGFSFSSPIFINGTGPNYFGNIACSIDINRFFNVVYESCVRGNLTDWDWFWNQSIFFQRLAPFNNIPIPIITSPINSIKYNRIDPISFDGSLSNDPDKDQLSFYWESNVSGYIGSLAKFDRALSLGDHLITLWINDGFGHNTSITVNISVVNRPPVAKIITPKNNDTFYSYKQIEFNGTLSYDPDGDSLTFFWSLDDIALIMGNNSTFNLNMSKGKHIIKLQVLDSLGAIGFDTVNITVANAIPIARISANLTTVLTGETILFDSSGSGDVDGLIRTYFINYGDGINSTLSLSTHSYSDEGNYTVNLTVQDDEGAEGLVSINIEVINRPPTISVIYKEKGIIGQKLFFDASGSSDEDGRIIEYLWDFGDGINVSGAKPWHIFDQSGIFTISVRAIDDDGGESTSSLSVKIGKKDESSQDWFWSVPFWLIIILIGMTLVLLWKGYK